MLWIVNFYMAVTSFLMSCVNSVKIVEDAHSWTDDELDKLTPETKEQMGMTPNRHAGQVEPEVRRDA